MQCEIVFMYQVFLGLVYCLSLCEVLKHNANLTSFLGNRVQDLTLVYKCCYRLLQSKMGNLIRIAL